MVRDLLPPKLDSVTTADKARSSEVTASVGLTMPALSISAVRVSVFDHTIRLKGGQGLLKASISGSIILSPRSTVSIVPVTASLTLPDPT